MSSEPRWKSYRNPTPCFLDDQRIEKIARDIHDQISGESTTSLVSSVRRFGGKIIPVGSKGYTDTEDRSLVVHEPRNFEIYLPADMARREMNWRIAHELGHLFMHYALQREGGMTAPRYSLGRVDLEADLFADALLVPAGYAFSKNQGESLNTFELSQRYSVSYNTIERVRARHGF